MLQRIGWPETWCVESTYFWIYDQQHGGSDNWFSMTTQHDKGAAFCLDNRYRLRKYTSSPGDTHNPGFKNCSVTPVHWGADLHPSPHRDCGPAAHNPLEKAAACVQPARRWLAGDVLSPEEVHAQLRRRPRNAAPPVAAIPSESDRPLPADVSEEVTT